MIEKPDSESTGFSQEIGNKVSRRLKATAEPHSRRLVRSRHDRADRMGGSGSDASRRGIGNLAGQALSRDPFMDTDNAYLRSSNRLYKCLALGLHGREVHAGGSR